MNKNHVFNDLSSYIDNQLSQEEKERIEEHLKDCQLCAQEFSRLKALSEKLKDWQAPDLGPFFEQAVKERISAQGQERGEVKMKKRTIAVLVPSGVLVGILVLLFVTPMYVKRGKQDRPEDRKTIATVRNAVIPDKYGLDYSEEKMLSSGYSGEESYGAKGAYSPAANRAERLGYAQSKIAYEAETPAAGEGSVIIIQPLLPATGQGDYIIRTAQVSLEVEDGQEAYKAVSEVCRELGGYLAGSTFHKDAQGRQSGTITMRIPKDKFLTALEKLNTLGKAENVYTSSQDISQEYANLKARLDAAMVVYNKMIEALQKRQATIPDAIRMESELGPVLQRIEQLKNKIEYYNNAVAFTTITVQFREPQVSAKVLKESKKYIEESILTAKINAVKFFARAVPAAIAVLFLVTVLLGVIAVAKFMLKRIFKRE